MFNEYAPMLKVNTFTHSFKYILLKHKLFDQTIDATILRIFQNKNKI